MAQPRRLSVPKARTPFPWPQLCILGLCRICEPIAFMSIFPYIYYMIESFNITTDENWIAIYAGMVTSAFTFAEFSASMFWGRVSDRVGRKPILLSGLAGTGLSMIVFGFAPNLAVAIFARALGGLLNGNIGVLQTTVAELVTVKEHQARAYTVMPFVWGLGSIVGPAMGGALARPCISYPSLFPAGTIWERFPFLLPNIVCTIVVVFSVTFGWLFVQETHPKKKHDRDRGIELGKKILKLFRRRSYADTMLYSKVEQSDFDSTDEYSPYSSEQSSPLISTQASTDAIDAISLEAEKVGADAPKKAFTPQVMLTIAGYGILAYHTITFDQLLPVMLSTPNTDVHENLSLPLKFIGGFGKSTKEIGLIITSQGLYSMFVNLAVFPWIVKRLGAINLWRFLGFSYPFLYLVTPYMLLLPDNLRNWALYPILVWKCTFSNLAYPACGMLLANAAPSLLLLGRINGAAASSAALNRAIGPTLSGLIYSAGLTWGYAIPAWWCSALVAVAGAVVSVLMSGKVMRDDLIDEDMLSDEEADVLLLDGDETAIARE